MSLLDEAMKARANRRGGSAPRHGDDQMLELCMAWLNGKITTAQAAVAIGVKTTGHGQGLMSSWVAHAIRRGVLKVEVVK